jgi:hypothetical protein
LPPIYRRIQKGFSKRLNVIAGMARDGPKLIDERPQDLIERGNPGVA